LQPIDQTSASDRFKDSVISSIPETDGLQQIAWNNGGFPPEIKKVPGNKDLVRLCIRAQIVLIDRAVSFAVMGVRLVPFGFAGIVVIDIIPDHHLPASVSDRLFIKVRWIRPVLVKREFSRNVHRENALPRGVKS
jgi:hypothetical protein